MQFANTIGTMQKTDLKSRCSQTLNYGYDNCMHKNVKNLLPATEQYTESKFTNYFSSCVETEDESCHKCIQDVI